MDVKTVCLGMLSDGEASGYDLKKQFESIFVHFFAAGYGSIYPALAALKEEGLVECREEPQEGRPDRKVYRITPAGREHLVAALDAPNPSHKIRSEFLATMCFAHLMTAQQIQRVLENRMAEVEDYLVLFDELKACATDWSAGMQFVYEFGKALTEAKRDFLAEHGNMLLADRDRKNTALG